MKTRDTRSIVVDLWPLPAAVSLLLWPCLGVSLAVGTTAFTLAFVVSDLDGGRPQPFIR